jgi:medium-chain acyl-[acyl-carrier-protein] hydrolase
VPDQRTRSAWLPFGTSPGTAVRLLCLPHAGAGATVYRTWAAGLADGIGACPVEPPGRGRRRREPPADTVSAITGPLAREVAELIRSPYAIFGHSTGALCAFELIRELRRIGAAGPAHLFVAGRRAPQLPMTRTRLGHLSIAELVTVLRGLGGTPEEVLADHDMLRMIQPMLVADFAVNEGYVYRPEAPLDTPVTAFAATADPGADPGQVAAWHEQTSAGFTLHPLAGGHFAVFDHAPEVLAAIAATIAERSG